MTSDEIYKVMWDNMHKNVRVKFTDGEVIEGNVRNIENPGDNDDIPGCEGQTVYYVEIDRAHGAMFPESDVDTVEAID